MTSPFSDTIVSVVIPTTGRASLAVAVHSVLRQKGCIVDPIVVFDMDYVPDGHKFDGVRMLATGGAKGGSAARNLGVEAAIGDFVAFLDDDDEWLPGKLQTQLERAQRIAEEGRTPVVGSRVLQRRAGSAYRAEGEYPKVLIGSGQTPQDYLFKGRLVTLNRPLFPTSTLLTTTDLARRVTWKTSLRRHQDWQWLVEAGLQGDVEIVQVEDATTVYTIGSAKSLSARPDWRTSLDWVRSWRGVWDRRAYADFLAAQGLRYALQSRDAAGVRHVLAELVDVRTMPSWGSVTSGMLGLAPRKLAERAAVAVGGWVHRRSSAAR